MNKTFLAMIRRGVCCLALFVPLTLGAQQLEFPDNPLAGQKVFVEKGCVNCHSIMGKGGKVGSDLGKTLANRSPAGIVAMMWNHAPEMSQAMQRSEEMPVFTEKEMAAIIAYIYYLNYFDVPGDAQKGERVVAEKGCLKCHSIAAKGGNIGPPLDKVRQYASPVYFAQTMWNHGSGMTKTMERMGVERPRLEENEMVDMLAYLRRVSEWKSADEIYLTPGSPKVGESLFEQKSCIRCHRIGERGRAIGPDLTQKKFHAGVTQIAATMWNHGPAIWKKMEAMEIEQPKFEGNEMADIAAYLYFLAFINETGDEELGKGLFSKKGCLECHSLHGRGGNVAPDLAASSHTSNYIKAATAMWNHNRKMRLLMTKAGVAVPRFNEEEMTDLLAYIRSERATHGKK